MVDEIRSLAGEVALVTGGGSGIGLATASRLHEAGAAVAIVDRDGELAEQGAALCGGISVQADVSQPQVWEGIVDAVHSRLGTIELLHLNAGVTVRLSEVTEITDEIYRRAIGVNIDGVFFGIRALVPDLSECGGGIVVTSSMAGIAGLPSDPIYSLTKHAIIGLVRSLSPTLMEQNILINAVCPNAVDTPLIDNIRADLIVRNYPMLGPAVVAEAIVNLFAGSRTGEALVIQVGREPLPFRFSRPPGPRPVDGGPS